MKLSQYIKDLKKFLKQNGDMECWYACARINIGLKYMGFELDKEYFEKANKRINDFKAQGNLFDILNDTKKEIE